VVTEEIGGEFNEENHREVERLGGNASAHIHVTVGYLHFPQMITDFLYLEIA
jgi:hypothetical protein